MNITENMVKEENVKVYDAGAFVYDTLHPEVWNWYEQNRYLRLVNKTLELSNIINPQPLILDLGAGTGNLTLKYLNAGCRVVSVDISKEMLNVLEMKLSDEIKHSCTLINSDIENALAQLPELDGVCCSSVLHHLYDYENIVRQLIAKIKPGGFFFSIHEPLIQMPKSHIRYKFHRLIGRIDESIYTFNIKRLGYNLKTDFPDDTIAEYHQTAGTFDYKKFVIVVKDLNTSIVHFETYASRRYGLFGWFASEIIGSENSFAMIAKKS